MNGRHMIGRAELARFCLALGLGLFSTSACVSRQAGSLELIRKPSGDGEREPFQAKPPVEMPFHVLNNQVVPPAKNFVLSGFMGDVADLRVAGSYTNVLVEGIPVLKIQYEARGGKGWAGVVWQNPANSWGAFDGGYNLSRAKQLSFWARGERGGEIVSFTCGGTAANFPDSDSISTGEIQLGERWLQYVIDLAGADLSYIGTGFGFVIKQDLNPEGCVFYLDDIRFN